MDRATPQTTAGWSENHRRRKLRTTVAEHATTTDEAEKRQRSHLQTLWRTDTDYLIAHRKPARRLRLPIEATRAIALSRFVARDS